MHLVIPPEVVLDDLLGDAIRGLWVLGCGLFHRQLGGTAVDGSSRRGEHHFAGTGGSSCRKQSDGADHIDLGIMNRIVHRGPHLGLGRQVKYHLRLEPTHHISQFGSPDVGYVDSDLGALSGFGEMFHLAR